MAIEVKPIGVIHSPYRRPEDIPRPEKYDPQRHDATQGAIEIFPEYEEGLKDIEGFSHLIVLFSFHKSHKTHLTAHPPYQDRPRGVFATRSPHRPNSIGMTVVELHSRRGNQLVISGIDMIDGTPVLDIKPYTLRDQRQDIRLGWIASIINKTTDPDTQKN
jgi:tRNA-Thr(GGU) m(6)t(6)A37 methyltransferase TsaA